MLQNIPRVDLTKSNHWIYPDATSKYKIRDYQLDICKQALFINTLVCLPTGLGKTLIAAVVMYNYYRWFPTGKIIFLAPTKPLAQQQIAACYNIMGIPEEDTAFLEGSTHANKREVLYKQKRMFFCTPQTLLNDLQSQKCCVYSIVCIVIDEAHRATNNYAYTSVIQEMNKKTNQFRILALSATPGSDIRKVQTVVHNLHISHIEVRTEDDPEIIPYTHTKQIDIIPCKHGERYGYQCIREYIHVLMEYSLEQLNTYQVIYPPCISAELLTTLHIQDAEQKLLEISIENLYDITTIQRLNNSLVELKDLLQCKKILLEYGIKALLEKLYEIKRIYLEYKEKHYNVFLEDGIVMRLQYQQLIELLKKANADSSYLDKRQPKISKVKEILLDHFHRHTVADVSTRVLIFTQLRSTVHEIKSEISFVPGVKANEFVGQGTSKSVSTYYDGDDNYSNKGLSQVEQSRILKDFNTGVYNVLVATCIAEEGLDIAEVDLIILFEAVASPVRLVQRCGRTGRQRSGKVVMLVAEGIEEVKVDKSNDDAYTINKTLKNATRSLRLYENNPVMLPSLPVLKLTNIEINAFRPENISGNKTAKNADILNKPSKSKKTVEFEGNNVKDKEQDKILKGNSIQKYLNTNTIKATPLSTSLSSSVKETSSIAVVETIDLIDDEDVEIWEPRFANKSNNSNVSHYNKEHHNINTNQFQQQVQHNQSNKSTAISNHSYNTSIPSIPSIPGNDHYSNDKLLTNNLMNDDDIFGWSFSNKNPSILNPSTIAYPTMSSTTIRNISTSYNKPDQYNITQNKENVYSSQQSQNIARNNHLNNRSDGRNIVNTKNSMWVNNLKNMDITNLIDDDIDTDQFTYVKNPVNNISFNSSNMNRVSNMTNDNNKIESQIRCLEQIRSNSEQELPNQQKTELLPTKTELQQPLQESQPLISYQSQYQNTATKELSSVILHQPQAKRTVTFDVPILVEAPVDKQSSKIVCSSSYSINNHQIAQPYQSNRLTNISYMALDDSNHTRMTNQNLKGSNNSIKHAIKSTNTTIEQQPSIIVLGNIQLNNVIRSTNKTLTFALDDSDEEQIQDPINNNLDENNHYFHVMNSNTITDRDNNSMNTIYINPNISITSKKNITATASIKDDKQGNILNKKNQFNNFENPCIDIDSKKKQNHNDRTYSDNNNKNESNNNKDKEIEEVEEIKEVEDYKIDDIPKSLEYSDDTSAICSTCLNWESLEDDPIVFCDGLCGTCTHVSCYGLLTNGVPEDDFYCESCEWYQTIHHKHQPTHKIKQNEKKPICKLCMKSTGSMKRSVCGKYWAHAVCVYFTPELTIEAPTNRVNNILDLYIDRKYIVCYICKEPGGAVVQCHHKSCLIGCHPYCAYQQRYQMIIRETNNISLNDDSEELFLDSVIDDLDNQAEIIMKYELYCKKHKESYLYQDNSKNSIILGSRNPLKNKKLEYIIPNQYKSYDNNDDDNNNDNLPNNRKKDNRKTIVDLDLDECDLLFEATQTIEKSKSNQQFVNKRLLRNKNTNKIKNISSINKNKMKKKLKDVEHYFEVEAVLSGSDLGNNDTEDDEEEEDIDTDDDSVLSGGFINDGEYTQSSSKTRTRGGNDDTQYGMYLAVNNFHMQMQSPDDFDSAGKPNIAKLLKRNKNNKLDTPLEDTSTSLDIFDSAGSNSSYTINDHLDGNIEDSHTRLIAATNTSPTSLAYTNTGTASSNDDNDSDDGTACDDDNESIPQGIGWIDSSHSNHKRSMDDNKSLPPSSIQQSKKTKHIANNNDINTSKNKNKSILLTKKYLNKENDDVSSEDSDDDNHPTYQTNNQSNKKNQYINTLIH